MTIARRFCLLLALLGASSPVGAQVNVQTEVSRTSLFPGDRFQYRIAVTAPRQTRIALEDFHRNSVNFQPFVILEAEESQEELPENRVRYIFDYTLINFERGDRMVEIPAQTFRYEEEQAAASGQPGTRELQIPAVPLAVRTTLNAPVRRLWIRESWVSPLELGRQWLILSLGVLGLLVSSLPLALWAGEQVARWKERRRLPGRKKFLAQCQEELAQLEQQLQASRLDPKGGYDRLEGLVRNYVLVVARKDAQAWTPRELRTRLNASEVSQVHRETLLQILEHGQHCRYGPDSGRDWLAELKEDLRRMRRVCT